MDLVQCSLDLLDLAFDPAVAPPPLRRAPQTRRLRSPQRGDLQPGGPQRGIPIQENAAEPRDSQMFQKGGWKIKVEPRRTMLISDDQ